MMVFSIEKAARKAAFYLLNARDGHHGLRRHMRAFQNCASMDQDALYSLSLQNLKSILTYAYENVPYYRKIWDVAGVHPSQLLTQSDIKKFGFIDKQTIKTHKGEMKSSAITPEHFVVSYTGGTTGTQSSFLVDKSCIAIRMGRQWGMLKNCGYTLGEHCGLIWGVHDDLPKDSGSLKFKERLRRFASGKEILHCAVLTTEKMSDFHSRLIRFKPTVLYGYPKAISHFAQFLIDENIPSVKVRTIICTAEKLTRKVRELIESVFGGEVFNLYCTREHGCIGFECNRHDGFHIDVGSLLLEIIKNGEPVKHGESGEIVITDFNNHAMPFIRNRIGDFGTLSPEACECGCSLPLLKSLEGRVTDTLFRSDGSKVDGGILTDIFIDIHEIRAMQIIQKRIDKVELKLVVTENFSDEIEGIALAELQQMLGNGMRIDVRKVDDIPRNPVSGKYQEVICRISPPSGRFQ